MNIKSIINPLIFGQKGIDDKAWKIKFTRDNNGSLGFYIRCKNTFSFKTKSGRKKIFGFCVILSMDSNGKFEFNKIALVGKVNDHLQRRIAIDDIYKIFRESIEDKLKVIDHEQ